MYVGMQSYSYSFVLILYSTFLLVVVFFFHVVFCLLLIVFVLFKPKTAYDMRISDWSSDVCSSDLTINPTADRLRLATQLGVENVVLDTRPNAQIEGADGNWDAGKVADYRRWVESLGLEVECMSLDVGSFLLDTVYQPARAAWRAEKMRADICAAAEGGLAMLKYNLQMVGITRTGRRRGRGGVLESAFRAADYSPEADRAHSYWGVGHPGGGVGTDIAVNAVGTAEAVGQVIAAEITGVSAVQAWAALEQLVAAIVPTAERAGVQLAAHPHEPAFPKGGPNGVEPVVGHIPGLDPHLHLPPRTPGPGK